MSTSRPAVAVTPIANEAGDLTHCVIRIDDTAFDATFTEAHTDLRSRIEDLAGVELTTKEVMTVTNASRQQMEVEAERLKLALSAFPAGTVALLDDETFFWLDAKQDLVWDQYITLSEGEITPGLITCIGEIDTEELWALAESIRKWLREPVTAQGDVEWLNQA